MNIGKQHLSKRCLVIIRHAHRNKRYLDNGLSQKGKKQTVALMKYFRIMYKKKNITILSSPKRRCVETVEPLSQLQKKAIVITKDLDEGGSLARNVSRFFRAWKKKTSELTVICSHGDWISQALRAWTGASVELSKGGLIELRLNKGQMTIERILQNTDLETLH